MFTLVDSHSLFISCDNNEPQVSSPQIVKTKALNMCAAAQCPS